MRTRKPDPSHGFAAFPAADLRGVVVCERRGDLAAMPGPGGQYGKP